MASFDKLTNQSLWLDALYVVVGFAVPAVLRRTVEGDGTDLPNEVYGVATAAAGYMLLSGRTANRVAAGSGAYVLAKLGERFDLIEPVEIRFKTGGA